MGRAVRYDRYHLVIFRVGNRHNQDLGSDDLTENISTSCNQPII